MINRNIVPAFCILVFGCIFFACSNVKRNADSSDENNKILFPSIFSLIANPQKYDGHQVSVAGYFSVELENITIYPSKQLAEIRDSSSGIWIYINPFTQTGFDIQGNEVPVTELNNRWIFITGTFRHVESGHFNIFPSSIENISMIVSGDSAGSCADTNNGAEVQE